MKKFILQYKKDVIILTTLIAISSIYASTELYVFQQIDCKRIGAPCGPESWFGTVESNVNPAPNCLRTVSDTGGKFCVVFKNNPEVYCSYNCRFHHNNPNFPSEEYYEEPRTNYVVTNVEYENNIVEYHHPNPPPNP